MSTPLRAVFHGLRHEHANGKIATLAKMRDEFEIVAIVDDTASSSPTWHAKRDWFDNPEYKGEKPPQVPRVSAKEALTMPDIDVVFIETANGDLLEAARPWAERGVAMHLDKPTGETREPFRELVDICRAKNVPLQLGYMFRANPGISFVQKAVREGWLGKVVHVEADMNHGYGDDEYQRYVSTFRCGVFYNLACHLLDAIVPMMEGDVVRADTVVRAAPGDPPNSRNRCVSLVEWRDSTACIRVCSRVPGGQGRRNFRVDGTKGSIELPRIERFDGWPLVGDMTLSEPAGGYDAGRHHIEFGVQTDRYAGQLLELAKIVRGEIPNPQSLYDRDLRVHDALCAVCGSV